MKMFIEVCGWTGMILLLVAYACKDSKQRRAVALCNLLGALLLGAKCLHGRVYPGVLLEVIWAAIAIRDLLMPGTPVSAGDAHRP